MTVTLQVNSQREAELTAQARAQGKSVEEYLVLVLESLLSPTPKTLSSEQRADAFVAWSASHRHTPLLSDCAVSREGIYEGRNG